MPLSAYVIRFAARERERVLRQLTGLAGVAVGTAEARADGVAVVVDTATTEEAEEAGRRLQDLEGVKSATLVYHNFEDVAETGEPPVGRASAGEPVAVH